MTVPTIQFEAKLMGYAKSRNKDGDWTDIRLQVHPEETEELNRLKLGQRLQCVIVAIGDDEQPVTPEKPKGGPVSQRAGMLCADKRFKKWLATHQVFDDPADYVRDYCGVKSRAELDHNLDARNSFRDLETAFQESHGMMPERRG